MQWRSLPKDLVIRIRRYYEHYYTRRAVFDETDILTQLNPQLHAEVVNYILNDSLGQLPLFAKLNPDFKLELFPLLKPISFAPGDIVYRKARQRGEEAWEPSAGRRLGSPARGGGLGAK